MERATLLRDLGDGLILRQATQADAERLAEFNSKIHSDAGPDQPDIYVSAWTRDLLSGAHPTFAPGDCTIVEDTRQGSQIVSSMNLISQTWAYDGVRFGVGRPELVGTAPEYRNRGLVRAQFDVIHEWSAARGEQVQVITGIPYYYRLFGYEMALDLGGGRAGIVAEAPQLKDGESEPYQIRPAGEPDIPFIASLYEQVSRRYQVSAVWDAALWRYELSGKSASNVNRWDVRVITTPTGEPVGYLAHPVMRWGGMMAATMYELVPGMSWAAVTPSVIRYLIATGEKYPLSIGSTAALGTYGLWLGREHPVYEVIPNWLPRVRKPYAFYMRVPNLPAFLRHLTPVLERRLAGSPMAGYTGELKITFYNGGILLGFEGGRLVKSEAYQPTPVGHAGDAAFPGLTFLQLLFGYRTLDELRYAFADCWTGNDSTAALLTLLFPKSAANVWVIS